MSTYAYTQDVEDELKDLLRGLHAAMDHLVNHKDYDEAESIFRIIDSRMADLINKATVARLT